MSLYVNGKGPTRAAASPKIRLESFDASSTRCFLFCSYLTFATAFALVLVLKLGVDRASIPLDGNTVCTDNSTVSSAVRDASSAGGCSQPWGVNGTAFHALVSDLAPLDSGLALQLSPSQPRDSSGVRASFVFNADLEGRSDAGDAWQLLVRVANGSALLTCDAGGVAADCGSVTFIDTSTLSMGSGGGFNQYRVTVQYDGYDVNTSVANATYVFSYQRAPFYVSDVTVRVLALASCIAVLSLWLRAMLWQKVIHSVLPGDASPPEVTYVWTPPSRWLPQQVYVCILLATTFIWQNPFSLLVETVPGLPPAMTVAAGVCEYIGWACLFTFWYTLVDSYKVPLKEILAYTAPTAYAPPAVKAGKRSRANTGEGASAAVAIGLDERALSTLHPAIRTVITRGIVRPRTASQAFAAAEEDDTPIGVDDSGEDDAVTEVTPSCADVGVCACRYATAALCSRACTLLCCPSLCGGQRVHPHDPSFARLRSYPTSGAAFYGPKAVLCACLCLVGVAVQLLSDPNSVFGTADAALNPLASATSARTLLLTLCVLACVYMALLTIWAICFIACVYTTGVQLRALPYAHTRSHQLPFRVFLFQQLIIVAFVFFLNANPVVSFLFATWAHASPTTPDSNGTFISFEAQVSGIIRVITAARVPVGELLLISVYVYLLAYVYTPVPTHTRSTEQKVRTPRGLPPLTSPVKRENSAGSAASGGSGSSRSTSMPHAASRAGVSSMRASVRAGVEAGVRAIESVFAPSDTRFSLATACWLFDFSLAVYMDPPGYSTPSSFGPLPCPPHAFVLEGAAYDEVTDTFAMVCVRAHRVVLSFRGTVSQTNIYTDLNFTRAPLQLETQVASIPGVRHALPLTHSGFTAAYMAVRDRVRAHVASALARAGEHARLYVSGHSLGGALAQLAAFDLAEMLPANRRAICALAGSRMPSSTDLNRIMGGSGAVLSATRGVDARTRLLAHPHHATGALAMLVDDDVCAGRDPLDCVGIPPDADVHADAELEAAHAHPRSSVLASLRLTPRDGEPGAADHTCADDVCVYVFGAPRVGNHVFAAKYNSRIPFSFRVCNDGDLITGMPKFLCMYKHAGVEVWLDDTGNLIANPSFLEQSFRASARTSFNAHRMSAYRRGLIHARRNEGLIQFRAWAEMEALTAGLGSPQPYTDEEEGGGGEGGGQVWR